MPRVLPATTTPQETGVQRLRRIWMFPEQVLKDSECMKYRVDTGRGYWGMAKGALAEKSDFAPSVVTVRRET